MLVIANRLTKAHHFIKCSSKDEDITAEETAKMLIANVWKLHELSNTIIFDRGPQFVSLIWETLCKILQIKAKLSTAFHLESDDQSENTNQELKRYLRTYVNYQQNNWAEWLSITEFAFNACAFIFIDIFSFLANYGFESRMSFDLKALVSKDPEKKKETFRQRLLKNDKRRFRMTFRRKIVLIFY